MSKDSGKSEPSMDDILASIRRIIDEDGGKSRKAAPSAGEKSAGDVLELTEMVNEDGSVTSLPSGAAKPSAGPARVASDDEDPPIYADRGGRADQPSGFIAPEMTRPTLAGDPRAPNPPQPSERQEARPAPSPPPVQPQPAAPPRPAQSAPAVPPARPAQPSQSGSQISLTPVAPAQPSGMVSSHAAGAAAAAFDRLARAAPQQSRAAAPPAPGAGPAPTVGGRAVGRLAGGVLRPMLQQWLDTNLPAIVERLVQQEIQKLTRQ